MKVVSITGDRVCTLIDKPYPRVGRNYALIKVHVAPMCNEYVAYQSGVFLERNRRDSLGHEIAGEVIEVPSGSNCSVGQRVVALCGFPCGRCQPCRAGYYGHCVAVEDPRRVCDSESGEAGFAEYALKPDWMLVQIPDAIPYEHASMLCCGLGPAFGALERVPLNSGGTVLVTGLGPVGLGAVINAAYRGMRVIGVGRSPYRTTLARELGCDITLDPEKVEIRRAIVDLTGGVGPDIVLECSGWSPYQRLAADVVAPLGTVAFVGDTGGFQLDVNLDLVQKGARFIGSLDINRFDATRLLGIIGDIPDIIDKFITHRFPLGEAKRAFELQISRECGKVLLCPIGWK